MLASILVWMNPIESAHYAIPVDFTQQKMEVANSVAIRRYVLSELLRALIVIKQSKLWQLNPSNISAKDTQKIFIGNVHLAHGEY